MPSDQQHGRTYRMPYPDRYVPYLSGFGGLAGSSVFWALGPSWMWPFGFILGGALTPTLLGLILGGPTDAK